MSSPMQRGADRRAGQEGVCDLEQEASALRLHLAEAVDELLFSRGEGRRGRFVHSDPGQSEDIVGIYASIGENRGDPPSKVHRQKALLVAVLALIPVIARVAEPQSFSEGANGDRRPSLLP